MTGQLTCAIHQPNLFPRLSTLAKLHAADIWIALDDVQITVRDYQHRARLVHPDGRHEQWLTLPVRRPHGRNTRINQATVLHQHTSAHRVQQLVQQYYGRCPRWPRLRPIVEAVADLLQNSSSLVDVTELSTRLLLEHLGWHGRIVRSSSFTVRHERSARLADLAAAVNATDYLCGTGGARYLDEQPFSWQGIKVHYVDLPGAPALSDYRHASGLWWLAAVSWTDLRELFWARSAA